MWMFLLVVRWNWAVMFRTLHNKNGCEYSQSCIVDIVSLSIPRITFYSYIEMEKHGSLQQHVLSLL
jgi:hypothetical protein